MPIYAWSHAIINPLRRCSSTNLRRSLLKIIGFSVSLRRIFPINNGLSISFLHLREMMRFSAKDMLLQLSSRRKKKRRRSPFPNTCWKGSQSRSKAEGRSAPSSRSWKTPEWSRSKWGKITLKNSTSGTIRCRWPLKSLKAIFLLLIY